MKLLNNSIIVFFLIVLLLIVVVLYYIIELDNNYYSSFLLLVTVSVAFFSVFLFCISKQFYIKLQNEYFRICSFFLLGYLIVSFQRYIDILVGYEDIYNAFLFVSPFLINRAALLSLSGLLSFILGYLICNPQSGRKKNALIRKQYSINYLNCILFLAVCLFVYYNGVDYLLGSYSQEYLESKQGTISAYSEVIVRSLIFAILIIYTKQGEKKIVLFLVIFVHWVFSFMFLFLFILDLY